MSTMYDRIKVVCEGYIQQCYQSKLPPRQEIEIRLAFYGGMMATIQESSLIANGFSEDDAMMRMAEFYAALKKRALDLNHERTGL